MLQFWSSIHKNDQSRLERIQTIISTTVPGLQNKPYDRSEELKLFCTEKRRLLDDFIEDITILKKNVLTSIQIYCPK